MKKITVILLVLICVCTSVFAAENHFSIKIAPVTCLNTEDSTSMGFSFKTSYSILPIEGNQFLTGIDVSYSKYSSRSELAAIAKVGYAVDLNRGVLTLYPQVGMGQGFILGTEDKFRITSVSLEAAYNIATNQALNFAIEDSYNYNAQEGRLYNRFSLYAGVSVIF